jgi:hypothetical protein
MVPGYVIPVESSRYRHLEEVPPQGLSMKRYIAVSIAAGLLFALMDGLINANPLAQELFAVYAPIARPSLNAAAGLAIDLAYGFILAGLFLLLFEGIPGRTRLEKGLCFGIVVWFLRVAMQAASSWVMFTIPEMALLYMTLVGLGEMLVTGAFFGVTLKPGNLSISGK